MKSTKREPRYISIYNQLKKGILQGDYPYQSKLPSRNTMAQEIGVSIITIKHAYELLCGEGYVEAKERSGYYVIFRREDGFLIEDAEVPVLPVKHYDNVEDAFPFPVLAKTMRRVISDYGNTILQKSPNKGLLTFRESICKYLARNRNIYVLPEQIVIGSGAEYLYNLLVGIFGKNTMIALEDPSYSKIKQVYEMAGITCEMLPLGAEGIDSTALAASKADVLHISPYRSYPSGITASASKKYEYIRWAERGKRYIIEDDFESEFSLSRKPEETIYTMTKQNNVIYMNSFSKTISASFRVAYMVLPKQLVEIFDEGLGFYACTVPTFEQLVITTLLQNGDFERHINRIRRKKRNAKRSI